MRSCANFHAFTRTPYPVLNLVPVIQQLVRFVIEQYRDELIAQLRGNNDPQTIQEHEMAVAEGREAVASDLLNVLHSIPIQSIATNGPSLVGF